MLLRSWFAHCAYLWIVIYGSFSKRATYWIISNIKLSISFHILAIKNIWWCIFFMIQKLKRPSDSVTYWTISGSNILETCRIFHMWDQFRGSVRKFLTMFNAYVFFLFCRQCLWSKFCNIVYLSLQLVDKLFVCYLFWKVAPLPVI